MRHDNSTYCNNREFSNRYECRMNLKNIREQQVRNAKLRLLLTLTVVVVLLTVICFTILTNAKEISKDKQGIKYRSILVTSDDTLWDLAQEYTIDEGMSTKETVSEIMKVNNMTTDTIYSGQYIIVAYK